MDNNLIRTFLSIPLPTEVKSKKNMFYSTFDPLGGKINWIRSDNLHLTLKFIGYTPENSIMEIIKTLTKLFLKEEPFNLIVNNTGCFPVPERPRVLWMGIDGNIKQLADMVLRIEDSLDKIGFSKEQKAYHPHITIARIKYPQKKTPNVDLFLKSTYDPIDFMVDRVQFLSSELLETGTVYSLLKSFPLGESI